MKTVEYLFFEQISKRVYLANYCYLGLSKTKCDYKCCDLCKCPLEDDCSSYPFLVEEHNVEIVPTSTLWESIVVACSWSSVSIKIRTDV